MHHIYKITIITNSKIYIGQTKNISKRWSQHKIEALKDKPSMIINDAMKKYGIENCKIQIIDFAQNYWQADCLEQNYIKQLNSHIKNGKGYNVSLGGPVSPKSEEFKQIMRDWHAAHPEHAEAAGKRLKGNTINLGKIASDETKQKQSEAVKKRIREGWIPVTGFTPGSEATKYWKGKESPNKGKSLPKKPDGNNLKLAKE